MRIRRGGITGLESGRLLESIEELGVVVAMVYETDDADGEVDTEVSDIFKVVGLSITLPFDVEEVVVKDDEADDAESAGVRE